MLLAPLTQDPSPPPCPALSWPRWLARCLHACSLAWPGCNTRQANGQAAARCVDLWRAGRPGQHLALPSSAAADSAAGHGAGPSLGQSARQAPQAHPPAAQPAGGAADGLASGMADLRIARGMTKAERQQQVGLLPPAPGRPIASVAAACCRWRVVAAPGPHARTASIVPCPLQYSCGLLPCSPPSPAAVRLSPSAGLGCRQGPRRRQGWAPMQHTSSCSSPVRRRSCFPSSVHWQQQRGRLRAGRLALERRFWRRASASLLP